MREWLGWYIDAKTLREIGARYRNFRYALRLMRQALTTNSLVFEGAILKVTEEEYAYLMKNPKKA